MSELRRRFQALCDVVQVLFTTEKVNIGRRRVPSKLFCRLLINICIKRCSPSIGFNSVKTPSTFAAIVHSAQNFVKSRGKGRSTQQVSDWSIELDPFKGSRIPYCWWDIRGDDAGGSKTITAHDCRLWGHIRRNYSSHLGIFTSARKKCTKTS